MNQQAKRPGHHQAPRASSQKQQILTLLRKGGLTYSEIAAEVGCHLSTVKKHLLEARTPARVCQGGDRCQCVRCLAEAYTGEPEPIDTRQPEPTDPTPAQLEAFYAAGNGRKNRNASPLADPISGIREIATADLFAALGEF
jgi:hypothetical protein